jgi:hypothetical protein
MHGMRKFKSWDPAESLVRLQNAALPASRAVSREELRRHGHHADRVFFSARGILHDATDSPAFARRGEHGQLAGHGTTFALATMSLDPRDLDRQDFMSLDAGARASLGNWITHFD